MVEDMTKLTSVIDEYIGDRGLVVVKAFEGSGGKQVYIDTPKNILKKDLPPFPLLLQTFIDSSGGIADLAPGLHDLRVYALGGKIIGGALRQPKEGSLYSNTNLGGNIKLLEEDDIPQAAKDMTIKIDSKLKKYRRFYSADFMCANNKWYLIELNSKPGLCAKYQGSVGIRFQKELAAYMVSMADDPLKN